MSAASLLTGATTTQGTAVPKGVAEHPERILRRIVPDPVQLQVILGSLLGDGRLEGGPGERRVRIAHRAERAEYIWWKYERLGALAAAPPAAHGDRLEFRTITHPLFDDLAPYFTRADARHRVRDLLAPLGLAVWMTDVGRLQLREDVFPPMHSAVALSP